MATAQTIINDALKEIGVLSGEGSSATATESDDALRALNRMVALESNNLAFDYSASHETIALTGQSSFTIGPSGNISTARPIKIDKAQAVLGGITTDVRIIDVYEYDSIAMKTCVGSIPEVVYYDGAMVDGIAYPWPQSTCTLNMLVVNLVTTFSTLSSTLSMPQGYESWMIKALAVEIAPQYPGAVLSPLTIQSAKNALKIIKRTNKIIPKLTPNVFVSGESGLLAIKRGY